MDTPFDVFAAHRTRVEGRLKEVRAALPGPPTTSRSYGELGHGIRPQQDWSLLRARINQELAEAEKLLGASRETDSLQQAIAALQRAAQTLEEANRQIPELSRVIAAHDEAAARHETIEGTRTKVERERQSWAGIADIASKISRNWGKLIFWGIVLFLVGFAWSPLALVGGLMVTVAILGLIAGPIIGARRDQLARERDQMDRQITH